MVGFVEHEGRDGGERNGVVVDQVEQAAGRGDDHVGTAAERHHLWVDGDAAVDDERFDWFGEEAGVVAERFADLGGEFAGGDENQRADETAAFAAGRGDVLEDREREGGGFA